MQVAILVTGLVCLGYGALVAGLYVAQRALLYHPNGDRPRPGPALAHLVTIQEVPSHDGLGLFSWWAPPARPDAPVIVYFHGNAGTQYDREERVAGFISKGWGVLMPGYRYNSGAGGDPSETALIADGKAVLDWVVAKGVLPDQIVLFGESLGSGVATALAREEGAAAALVLDAPYDSIMEVAAKVYWYVPVRHLLKDPFDSHTRIGDVRIPVLIGHGGEDTLIPDRHGRRLFEAANEPKIFVFKPEAGHTELFEFGFLDDVDRFLADHALR